MRTRLLLALATAALATNTALAADGTAIAPEQVRLCRALAMVGVNEHVPVVLTGILKDDFFYDPLEPVCPLDVQPSTYVEFRSALPPEAEAILARDSRLMVTLEGDLFGPLPSAEGEIGQNIALRVSQALRRRFGLQKYFRTKLEVTAVLGYGAVPHDQPWSGVVVRPVAPGSLPEVLQGRMPVYPDQARRLGVQGVVAAAVEIVNGTVAEVRVLSAADPILSASAIATISTWQFRTDVTVTLETTFSYELERRASPADDNPRIEARLPAYVRIVGPTLDW